MLSCDRPKKVLNVTDDQPPAYDYDLSVCNARTIANCGRNSILTNKRRFSMRYSSALSGDGFDEWERGESLFADPLQAPTSTGLRANRRNNEDPSNVGESLIRGLCLLCIPILFRPVAVNPDLIWSKSNQFRYDHAYWERPAR
jgi:hypothetical protein